MVVGEKNVLSTQEDISYTTYGAYGEWCDVGTGLAYSLEDSPIDGANLYAARGR